MKRYLLIAIFLLAAFLRFWQLGTIPPSLYWDEASLGYNAYSILKTGRDEHGKFLPITNFAAFGDYKPPGYIYAAVPSISVFGLNEFAIRFPSAFFGTLTVLLTYFLAKKLFEDNGQLTAIKKRSAPALGVLSPVSLPPVLVLKNSLSMLLKWSIRRLRAVGSPSTGATPREVHPERIRGGHVFDWRQASHHQIGNWKLEIGNSETIALCAMFLLAISPWHLQFSRAAFEANLGLFFSTLGIFLFLKFAKDHPLWIFPSSLSFLAAMYTFTGQRLFVPFILLILAIQFKKLVLENIKHVLTSAVIATILFWPLFVFATQTIEGRLRFNEVTIFKELEPIDRSRRYRSQDEFGWWSALVHNRRFAYVREYLIHYFDAFNPTFLFTRGDVNPRLSVQEVGELYLVDLALTLSGIYFLFAKNHKFRFLIIAWLLVSPLGPATAREAPHALRMIHILPTFQLIAAFGVYHLYQLIKFKKAFITLTLLIFIFNFLFYLHMYYFHWPKNYSDQWQYGYKQAVEVVKSKLSKVDNVIVTKAQGRPYIYFLLYTQYDPQNFQQHATRIKDQFFFIDVSGFDKFHFTDDFNQINLAGKSIYVAGPGHLPGDTIKIATIVDLAGKSVFEIGQGTR